MYLQRKPKRFRSRLNGAGYNSKNFRVRLLSFFFLLFFLLLIVRLYYWQVYKGKQLSVEARSQYTLGQSILAERGDILASDGTWLAATTDAWLVYAELPNLEESTDKIADKLAPLFVELTDSSSDNKRLTLDEANRLKSVLTKGGVVWVPLKHKVNDEIKRSVESLEIGGIGFEKQEARSYPEGSAAAHILGFVGKNSEGEDQGYFGLEGYYDLSLSGKPGFLSYESDAKGVPILIGDSKEVSAIGGVDLITHIDKTVQNVVEKKMEEAIEMYGAKSATVIVMDPKTGGIIGMSSYPSYDPSDYVNYGDEFFRNPAISSSYEPGSVFKVIIMASALDAGVVEPDTECDICTGPYRVDKYYIETWDKTYHKDASMVDVIVNSDNVGMVFAGEKLGIDRMYEYLEAFGIGSLTGIDLQGEVSPKLREKDDWSFVDLATASFGQGVAVTPIQMLRAVSTIANDGVMVTPRVVDKVVGSDWDQDIKLDYLRRVISPKTALEVTAMMAEAAKNGESKWTHLRGYKVAGKTGTAQIPIAGHYDEEKTIASFVGFAPYDNPKFVMLATLQEPQSSQWASETAAPLWYSIANELFYYFGIQPEN